MELPEDALFRLIFPKIKGDSYTWISRFRGNVGTGEVSERALYCAGLSEAATTKDMFFSVSARSQGPSILAQGSWHPVPSCSGCNARTGDSDWRNVWPETGSIRQYPWIRGRISLLPQTWKAKGGCWNPESLSLSLTTTVSYSGPSVHKEMFEETLCLIHVM